MLHCTKDRRQRVTQISFSPEIKGVSPSEIKGAQILTRVEIVPNYTKEGSKGGNQIEVNYRQRKRPREWEIEKWIEKRQEVQHSVHLRRTQQLRQRPGRFVST